MDEKKVVNFKHLVKVLDKTQDQLEEKAEEKADSKMKYPNQTNPIYKKLATFCNEKIADKWSIKDLLR